MVGVLPVFLHIALEVHFDCLVRLGVEPYAAAGEPVVRLLGLPAVLQLLLEDAVLIADGVAGCGDLLGCHGIQIAGSQTAQTAVAQTGIRLALIDAVQTDAIVLEDGGNVVHQLQIVQRGLQGTSHQEFHRQIVYALSANRMGFIDKVLTLVLQLLDHQRREHLIDLLVRSLVRRDAAVQLEFVHKLLLQFFSLGIDLLFSQSHCILLFRRKTSHISQ